MKALTLRRALLACPFLGLAAVAAAQPAPAPPPVDWEHLPPAIIAEINANGGPVYAYRMVFNHFKFCALPHGNDLQSLSFIEQYCQPLPPAPTARNLFALDTVPKDEAKPIVRMYLEAQGYLRRPASPYVLAFMKASTDPDYADDLGAFQKFGDILKAADKRRSDIEHPPSFWANTFRLPSFSMADIGPYGVDPHAFVAKFNIPLFYILPLLIVFRRNYWSKTNVGKSHATKQGWSDDIIDIFINGN